MIVVLSITEFGNVFAVERIVHHSVIFGIKKGTRYYKD